MTATRRGLASAWGTAARQLPVLAPGSALCAIVALAATFVAQLQGGPQLLYALFFGVTLNTLSHDAKARPGIDFCGRQLLRLAVGLLGARITAAQIAALGWPTVSTVVLAVATTVAFGLWLARRLGFSPAEGVLSGGAVAICGASAALALAAVLPRDKRAERFTLVVVVGVTVLSTLAMVAYPVLVRGLGLLPASAGLFIGGSIHDVAQVVGAGYTLGPAVGDAATIVKLLRVSLLTVVVLAVSWAFRGDRARARAEVASGEPAVAAPAPALVPWFLWLFVALVVLNSTGALPPALQQALQGASRGGLVVAIAALGLKTSFMQLRRAGWRALLLLLAETAWLAGFVLAAIGLRAVW